MNIYRHHKTTNIRPGVNSLIRLTMKLVVVFLSTALFCTSAQLIESPPEVQLFLLQLRVRLLTNKLYDLCPDLIRDEAFVREKAADSLTVEQNLEIEQQIYEHVLALMDECNRQATTTTSTPLPSQCTSSATLNLTESWRNNYNGTNLRYDDILILLPGVTWFRFTGAAGNLLKNTCPVEFSCGSSGAYWSDSPLPTRVGETVNITFYESYYSGPLDSLDDCIDNGAHRGRATRCSADRGGVVYIMNVDMDYKYGIFCGMD